MNVIPLVLLWRERLFYYPILVYMYIYYYEHDLGRKLSGGPSVTYCSSFSRQPMKSGVREEN